MTMPHQAAGEGAIPGGVGMAARPWLVGVLGVPHGATRQQVHDERVRIAVEADLRRCTVLDIIEVDHGSDGGDIGYGLLERLAWSFPVQVFLVCGQIDLPRVEDLAERARVVVAVLPGSGLDADGDA